MHLQNQKRKHTMAEIRSMTSAEPTGKALHHDVREWVSEQELWVDELQGWLKQHQQALSDLAAIEQTLHRFADAAAKHEEAIVAYKPRLNAFDHKLAKYLQGDERQSLPTLQQVHAVLADEQKKSARTAQPDVESIQSDAGGDGPGTQGAKCIRPPIGGFPALLCGLD
jgi:hypothetical protein